MNDGLFYGVAGLVLGVIGGFLMFNTDIDSVEDRLSATVSTAGSEAAEAAAETNAALAARLSAIEEAIAAGTAADAAAAEERAALSSGVDGVTAELAAGLESLKSDAAAQGDALSAAIAAQGETLSAEIASLSGDIETVGEAAAAAAAAAMSTPAAPAEDAPATEEAEAEPAPEPEPEPVIEGVKAGETEILADGAVRIFVSGLDEETGTARVAINGTNLVELSVFGAAFVPDIDRPCKISLTAIQSGHAQFEEDCD